MRELAQEKIPRTAVRRRQQDVEQCLASLGLWGGPRRSPIGAGPAAGSDDTRSCRLRAALEGLGPVFASFGRYLSSRVDLFPARDCLELATIPDRAEATPMPALRDLILRETGRRLDEAYVVFEEEPLESRLIFQTHRAWLTNETPVTVTVVHPGFEEALAHDEALLPRLRAAFAGEWAGIPIDRAIADFRRALRQQMDCRREASSINALADDAREFDLLRVPIVYQDLCSSRVLTLERLPGSSLQDVEASFERQGSRQGATVHVAPEGEALTPPDLAIRLCLIWLRQVLLGRVFPVEVAVENVVILPDNQIGFTGGVFESLPADAKANLWEYLLAVATEDPDKACTCLLREMESEGRPANEDELRHRFRQVVPLRDGGWSSRENGQGVAEHLFVHWRLASERGYLPRPHLLSFYRGLFSATSQSYRLAPDRDALLEGLQEVRLIAGVSQVREMFSVRRLGDSLDKYVAIMMELPRKLDEVLTLAAEGRVRLQLQITETREQRRQKNSLAVVIALLLVLAAITLLTHHFFASTVAAVWADRISAVAFVLLGAFLLRLVSGAS